MPPLCHPPGRQDCRDAPCSARLRRTGPRRRQRAHRRMLLSLLCPQLARAPRRPVPPVESVTAPWHGRAPPGPASPGQGQAPPRNGAGASAPRPCGPTGEDPLSEPRAGGGRLPIAVPGAVATFRRSQPPTVAGAIRRGRTQRRKFLSGSRIRGIVPGRIRTCDLWLRRPTLYPAELQGPKRSQSTPGGAVVKPAAAPTRQAARAGRAPGLGAPLSCPTARLCVNSPPFRG